MHREPNQQSENQLGEKERPLIQCLRARDSALRALGIEGDLRVRYHGFARLALDLRGFRSGSLNVLGGVVSDAMPNDQGDARREAPAA